MEVGRVRQNGEREVIELTGEGGVGITHQTVYTRKRTGVQGEKTERSIGCYSASSQDTACQRSSKVIPPSPETGVGLTWCVEITQEGYFGFSASGEA